MKSVRTLLLYEDKRGCKLLRETTFAAGGEVEEPPFDPQAAARIAMGFSVVLFSVRQPARRFFEILRAWHDNAPETTLVLVSGAPRKPIVSPPWTQGRARI